MSAFFCVRVPSFKTRIYFFLITKTLQILQVLATHKGVGGEVAGSLRFIRIHRLVILNSNFSEQELKFWNK